MTNKTLWIALAVSLMGNGYLLMEHRDNEKLARKTLDVMVENASLLASNHADEAKLIGLERKFYANACPTLLCDMEDRLVLRPAQEAHEVQAGAFAHLALAVKK